MSDYTVPQARGRLALFSEVPTGSRFYTPGAVWRKESNRTARLLSDSVRAAFYFTQTECVELMEDPEND